MSIYEACDKVGSRLATITAPEAPATVRIVPPGHGDDRHAARAAFCWINVEPGGEEGDDETSNSSLVVYTVNFHAWYARPNPAFQTTAQKLGTLGASCVAALLHNSLDGWARHGIAMKDISTTYETGGEADSAYVVRGVVKVHRQQ